MHILYDVWIGDQKRARIEFTTNDGDAHALLSPQQKEIEQYVADAGWVLSQRIAQLFPLELKTGEQR